jgi:GH25 family lysozyme M1 (1,4-beta-N-acetylmuramidase)
MMKGIDVSSWQKRPNWTKIKKAGVEFAILRCHQKTGIDASFNYNYKNAKQNGIKLGVYKLTYAENKFMAEKEAEDVLEVLKGKEIDLPVFFDLEDDGGQWKFENSHIAQMAEAFLDKISAAGYKVGIYCNLNWYNNKITDYLKSKYDFWLASYPEPDEGVAVERVKPNVGNDLIMWQYSRKGSVNGITGDVDMDYLYKDYSSDKKADDTVEIDPETDKEVKVDKVGVTADDIIAIMRGWIGLSKSNKSHKVIIDTYNSYLPHPRGYAVTYDDDYCDTTVSAAFVKAGNVDIIGGIECGVEEHVKKFIKEGIWIEDGSIVPQVGDIICYNWDTGVQPNNGFSDHIGIVESINLGGKSFTTLEGNMLGGVVGRRTVNVGDGYIRGFARPKYATKSSSGNKVVTQKTITEIAYEVIEGKWGNGVERINRLYEAGYNVGNVQAKVNDILNGTKTIVTPDEQKEPQKKSLYVAKVIANKLNVRTNPGVEYPKIISYPVISYGNLVDVYDVTTDTNGNEWLYIRIAGQFYGYVSAEYMERV